MIMVAGCGFQTSGEVSHAWRWVGMGVEGRGVLGSWAAMQQGGGSQRPRTQLPGGGAPRGRTVSQRRCVVVLRGVAFAQEEEVLYAWRWRGWGGVVWVGSWHGLERGVSFSQGACVERVVVCAAKNFF